MTRINKSKDGIIGPGPKPAITLPPPDSKPETRTVTVGAKPPKAKKKAKKKFTPVMRAKKTK